MTDTPDEDLEIKIEGAETPHVNGATPDATDPAAGLEALKAQLADETARREAAERQRDHANQSAEQARGAAKDSDQALIANAIERVKVESGVLKTKYRDALVAQDFDAAADIQQQMTTAAVNLSKLEEGKIQLERQAQQRAADPVESLARQLTPRSADWVRKHPEFVRDPLLNQKMIAAHNYVVADGVAPDTDAYFDAVETMLRLRTPATTETKVEVVENPTSDAAQVVSTRQASAPPVAPVTRSGDGTGANRRTVRLSRDEVEMAEMMGMSPEDYAKNKAQLIKEGVLH